jgi:hypothetical protein
LSQFRSPPYERGVGGIERKNLVTRYFSTIL